MGSETQAYPGLFPAAFPEMASPGRPVIDFEHALEQGFPFGKSIPWIWSFMHKQAYSSWDSKGTVLLAAMLQPALGGATPGAIFFFRTSQ